MKPTDCILFSGGAPGAEAAFGACAERHGVEEVNFTFDGHKVERRRGVRVLNHEELLSGDVSLEYVSRLMHRRYTEGQTIRKVLQTLWYQVNSGQEIYVIGTILDDDTVKGGTGWGAEFAKLCNKPLFVFDQEKDHWSEWTGGPGSSWWRRASLSSTIRISPGPARARSARTDCEKSTPCSGGRSAPSDRAVASPADAAARSSCVRARPARRVEPRSGHK